MLLNMRHVLFKFGQAVKDDDNESTSSKSSNRSIKNLKRSTTIESDSEKEHPLKTLAKAARLMNPAQFDIGKEIGYSRYLPGKF